MAKQILIIDSDSDHAGALKTYVERRQYHVTTASTIEAAIFQIDRTGWDIILVNPFLTEEMPQYLNAFKTVSPLVQIIVLSPRDKLDEAIDLIEFNAFQYIEIPVNSKILDIALVQAGKNISLIKKINRYSEKLADLNSAQDILNQLFEEVPCYISVQDKNLRITAANKRFKNHFGSHIGGFCYEIYKHRTSPCHECPVVETFKDGSSHNTEEVVTSKFGKQYNVLTQTAPIRNGKGQITQVMEIATDITQIRQLQNHLISLGLMIGSMSHGVKGMLTALDGGIYQLETGLGQKDEERTVKAFGQIKQMADKIKKMVLEILYYAKARALQYEEMNIEDLVENVIYTIKPMTENYGIKFDVLLPENSGKIEVDSKWIEAALVNFLENAVDACVFDRDRKAHCIKLMIVKQSKDHIHLTISDDGIGMDTETKNKMFTLFFTSKGSQGTGLGLFIAQRVIRYHGGTVDVESEPGRGSKFIICLPLKKSDNSKNIEFPRSNR